MIRPGRNKDKQADSRSAIGRSVALVYANNILLYMLVFPLLRWTDVAFIRYRVAEHWAFSVLIGSISVLYYLWLMLLAEDLFSVLERLGDKVMRFVKALKVGLLLLVVLYGIFGVALWSNARDGDGEVRIANTRITGGYGLWVSGYGWMPYVLVEDWDGKGGTRGVLLTLERNDYFFIGQGVQISYMEGALGLYKVVSFKRDEIAYYNKMLEIAPASITAIKYLAINYAVLKDFETAYKYYKILLERGVSEGEIGRDLAARALMARQNDAAMRFIQRRLDEKRDFDSLYIYGEALAWAGRKPEAIPYFLEAAKLAPYDFRAFYALGYIYWDIGRPEDAERVWREALKLQPGMKEIRDQLDAMARDKAARASSVMQPAP